MKKDNTARNRYIRNYIITISVIILFVLGILQIINTSKDYSPQNNLVNITENICHNETHTDWDRENLEVPISKNNYTLPYSLGGLETTDFNTIFNFLNKDNKFGKSCQNESWDCIYYRIKPGYFSFEEYKNIYGNLNEEVLKYSRINLINITGKNIRVDGESVRNLDGNHNDILVSFEFNKFIIGTKTENIPVCESKEVNENIIKKGYFIWDNDYKEGHRNITLDWLNNPSKSFLNEWCKGNNLICIKDLNKEWLDKNCECSIDKKDRLTGWGGAYCMNRNDCEYDTECSGCSGQDINNCRCIYSKCSTYSCINGRYEVNVNG